MAIHGSSSPGTKWPVYGLFSALFYRKLEKRVKKDGNDAPISMVFAKSVSKKGTLPGKNCSFCTPGRVFKKNQKNPCIGTKKRVIMIDKFKGEKEKIEILLNFA
jgi:hypothetical protein